MTTRKLAMSILAIIILLEISYYMLYLKPPNDTTLTMADLNNDAKMKQLLERSVDDLQYGDERRTNFKYIMGGTVLVGFIIAASIPNRRI